MLVQIDIEEAAVTEVAKRLGKAKSTISSQHKKAFQKLIDWLKTTAPGAGTTDLDALVFREFNTGHTPSQVIAKYGHAEKVMKLSEIWKETKSDDYWAAFEFLDSFRDPSDSEAQDSLSKRVSALFDDYLEMWSGKEAAEKELAEYEKEHGTLKNIDEKRALFIHRISKLRKDKDDFEVEVFNLRVEKKNLLREKEELEQSIREQTVQAEKARVKKNLLESQLKELEKKMRRYSTMHGRNIKVGDLIRRKDYPLLYLVQAESDDGNSWKVQVFDKEHLEKLRKKIGLKKKTMEGTLSKKEAMEEWEIVDIGSELGL